MKKIIMNKLLKIYYKFICLGEQKIDMTDRLYSYVQLILGFAPIAYVLSLFDLWFIDNHKFVTGFIIIVVVNAVIGCKKHKKLNTFDFGVFISKTWKMLSSVIITYIVLHIISDIAGDNYIAQGFEITLQVTTLFYPASKILKNIFILTNGQYPPEWIMTKVYNFEKSGDLSDFLKDKNNND